MVPGHLDWDSVFPFGGTLWGVCEDAHSAWGTAAATPLALVLQCIGSRPEKGTQMEGQAREAAIRNRRICLTHLYPWWGSAPPAWHCHSSGWCPRARHSHSSSSRQPTHATSHRPRSGWTPAQAPRGQLNKRSPHHHKMGWLTGQFCSPLLMPASTCSAMTAQLWLPFPDHGTHLRKCWLVVSGISVLLWFRIWGFGVKWLASLNLHLLSLKWVPSFWSCCNIKQENTHKVLHLVPVT